MSDKEIQGEDTEAQTDDVEGHGPLGPAPTGNEPTGNRADEGDDDVEAHQFGGAPTGNAPTGN